jgi:hypothetical protein
MRKSLTHPIKIWGLTFFMICCTSAVLRGCPNACEDTYTIAIRLMRALYPDLKAKGANIDLRARYPLDADGPLLSFYIGTSASDQTACCVDSRSPNPSSADRVGQISAHFQFDGRDRRIFSIFANGSFVHEEKQEVLTKLVDEHPEWSDLQMTDALSQAGAKFGPDQKEALLARFPVKELEPILGKIEMDVTQFEFRGNVNAPYYAVMNGLIRFRSKSDGKRDGYAVSLEPFDGRVIAFGRRPID